MRNRYGKLFQNVQSRALECFSYNPQKDYYGMVQNYIRNGYQQTIFTSAVMLSLTEHFLLQHKAAISEIEFVTEDAALENEIHLVLERMNRNRAYWGVLKDRLTFLSKYDSIDIKKIEIRCTERDGFLVTLQLNGIVIVSENAYASVTQEILQVVRRALD